MTNQEIRDYFDLHLNCTMRELSRMTGKSIQELKGILNACDPITEYYIDRQNSGQATQTAH